MREFWRVVTNEWMKLVRRRRLWVTALLGLMIVGLFSLIDVHERNMHLSMSPGAQLKSLQQSERYFKQNPNRPNADQALASIRSQIQYEKQLISQEHASDKTWKADMKKQISDQQQQYKQMAQYAKAQHVDPGIDQTPLLQMQYEVAHNVQPLKAWEMTGYQGFNEFFDFTVRLFLPLLVVILVADMVSGETTSGTIKLLLVRPVSRLKVMVGKWFVSMIATVMMTLGLCLALFLAAFAIFGTKGGLQPQVVGIRFTSEPMSDIQPGAAGMRLVPHFDHAFVLPQWEYLVIGGLLAAFAMMAVGSIAFLCSTLFKSATAGTAVSLGIVIFGFILTSMAARMNLSWMRGLFSAQLNLLSDWSGAMSRSMSFNSPMWLGVVVLCLWAAVSLTASLVYFARKDVLNA